MSLIAVQKPTQAGAAIAYTAVTASDTFVNTGREFLHVKNGGGGACTVTITSPNRCSFGVINVAHNDVVTVGAGLDAEIGPFDKAQFSSPTNIVTVTYSPTTTVTAALLSSG